MKHIAVVKEPCLLRDGIIDVLKNKFPHFSVAAYRSSEKQQIYNPKHAPDLLMIDIDTDLNLMEVIDLYQHKHKKVIVWVSHIEDGRLLELFQKGLDGYFHYGMKTSEFISGVSTVLKGGCYVHPSLTPILLSDYVRKTGKAAKPDGVLSNREWEILELLTKGYGNEKIAQTLLLSDKTVKNHLSSIFKKLNVTDRLNAVLIALKKRWFVL